MNWLGWLQSLSRYYSRTLLQQVCPISCIITFPLCTGLCPPICKHPLKKEGKPLNMTSPSSSKISLLHRKQNFSRVVCSCCLHFLSIFETSPNLPHCQMSSTLLNLVVQSGFCFLKIAAALSIMDHFLLETCFSPGF